MTQIRRILPALATATLIGTLLGGCMVVPLGRYQGDEDVMVAPPPPQAEVMLVAPGPGFFWIAGHWGWNLGRHAWIGGRWEAPRQGYAWVPHQWQRRGPGWREAPGRWDRR